MTRALDRFDLASHGQGNLTEALAKATAEFLVVSFSSDWRFAPSRSQEIANALLASGKKVTYADIESDAGHDGFLLEDKEYMALVGAWMKRIAP